MHYATLDVRSCLVPSSFHQNVADPPMQSVATAVATAIAQTAGSVKGGPGCVGQANATASAKASALAESYSKVGAT